MAEIRPYKYFDTPDGQDVFKKLWCVLKPTTLVAFGVGTAEVLLVSRPKGYVPTLARYAFISWPLFAATTTFVCTTNVAASVREKDDVFNWFLGGFSAGSVIGVWNKRVMTGINMGIFLGLAAILKKVAVQNGWNLVPPDDNPVASRGIWEHDFTLTANRPGNWTTGK